MRFGPVSVRFLSVRVRFELVSVRFLSVKVRFEQARGEIFPARVLFGLFRVKFRSFGVRFGDVEMRFESYAQGRRPAKSGLLIHACWCRISTSHLIRRHDGDGRPPELPPNFFGGIG